MSPGTERTQQVMLEILTERSRVDDDGESPSSHWGLATMEHMFARRPELETYAWRIQGAV